MCGIAGFLGAGDGADLQRMTRRLTHRGPDAEGYFEKPDAGVFLGHRRLSIIDLACGAQPMVSADGCLAIVFNGEIYNHAELRSELLAKGHIFATDHSDTEVLLHAWREWGEGMLSRLNGMWAFAIYDSRTRRLFLARDRFGKKPLYYFYRNGTFAFASELTAILEHPLAPRNQSEIARVKFLAHALIPAPHSAIEGIYKLPAAHQLTVAMDGGSPRISRYWRYTLEPEESQKSESTLAADLLDILTRATRRRRVADVPLGIFLSGGLDSSTIAALAARDVQDRTLQTFTIGFKEPSFDESAFAAQVAGFLKTDHHTETLSLDAALEAMPGIFDLLDEPQGEGSLLQTWLLCRFARRHVTVVAHDLAQVLGRHVCLACIASLESNSAITFFCVAMTVLSSNRVVVNSWVHSCEHCLIKSSSSIREIASSGLFKSIFYKFKKFLFALRQYSLVFNFRL
jgi:asparagine synthase (glutamine-hydrolysing)